MDAPNKRKFMDFCFVSPPSPLHFASSYWPVITNLKNIARWEIRSRFQCPAVGPVRGARPCVTPCQKTPNISTLSPFVSRTRGRKFRSRPSVRVGMSVNEATLRSKYRSGLQRNFFFFFCQGRIAPTYPLRHNPPHSLVVLSVWVNPLRGQGGPEIKEGKSKNKREDLSAKIPTSSFSFCFFPGAVKPAPARFQCKFSPGAAATRPRLSSRQQRRGPSPKSRMKIKQSPLNKTGHSHGVSATPTVSHNARGLVKSSGWMMDPTRVSTGSAPPIRLMVTITVKKRSSSPLVFFDHSRLPAWFSYAKASRGRSRGGGVIILAWALLKEPRSMLRASARTRPMRSVCRVRVHAWAALAVCAQWGCCVRLELRRSAEDLDQTAKTRK